MSRKTLTIGDDVIQGGITANFVISDSFRIQIVLPAYNNGQQTHNRGTPATPKKGDSDFGELFKKVLGTESNQN